MKAKSEKNLPVIHQNDSRYTNWKLAVRPDGQYTATQHLDFFAMLRDQVCGLDEAVLNDANAESTTWRFDIC